MIVCVVIPTFNEKENIANIVERLSSVEGMLNGAELRILFVDDGSPDGTASEIRRLVEAGKNLQLLERSSKMGIATAYRDGFRRAIETFDPSVFVQIDADLQHPPDKMKELVEAILDGANVALGSRYVPGGGIRGWSWGRTVISKGANWLARTLLGLEVKDVTTGFKALDKRAVTALLSQKLSSSGFTYQVESLVVYKKAGLRVVEVPYTFVERTAGKSKLSSKEIFEFLKTVLALALR